MAEHNGYIYVAFSPDSTLYGSTLEIIDISNPVAPTKVGAIALDGIATGIAAAGQHAYVVSDLFGPALLYAIDISDPASPRLASRFDLDSHGQVAITANTAYVSHPFAGPTGVSVLDISDPYHMRQTSSYKTEVAGNSAIGGEFMYVSGSNGLLILKAVTLTTRSYLSRIDRT
jgi:hypothetical protein